MNSMKIPHGDDLVTVELTVKELMALAGIRFHGNHRLEIDARKKLNSALSETFELEQPIPYQLLS